MRYTTTALYPLISSAWLDLPGDLFTPADVARRVTENANSHSRQNNSCHRIPDGSRKDVGSWDGYNHGVAIIIGERMR